MSAVVEAREQLAEIALELGNLSKGLADVSRRMEPLQREYQEYVDNYELGLLQRSMDDDKFKLPSADLRLKLARREFTREFPEKMGHMMAFDASRDRMKQRISDLKHLGENHRSVLSALKAELEAIG